MKEAMHQLSKDHGIQWTSIYVPTPEKDKGNWCDIMPTETKYLLWLGVKMGMIMQQQNQ